MPRGIPLLDHYTHPLGAPDHRPGENENPGVNLPEQTRKHGRTARAYKRLLGRVARLFALAETPSTFQNIEGWLRRRLRMCLWKQWKRVRTRYRELRALGLPERVVHELANARKGPWRMAHGPMNRALGNAYWQSQGLMSLTERLIFVKLGEPPEADPHVRWCERRGLAAPSYSIPPSQGRFYHKMGQFYLTIGRQFYFTIYTVQTIMKELAACPWYTWYQRAECYYDNPC